MLFTSVIIFVVFFPFVIYVCSHSFSRPMKQHEFATAVALILILNV